jgi:GST-like protein
MTAYRLYARAGWGSAIVEAQLACYGLTFEIEEVGDLFASEEARTRLAALNPLPQLPTLVLPDGEVMTESAAITLQLAEATGQTSLVPAPGEPGRPAFLRWLVFLVANIYPTFTYADDPRRFVTGEEAQKAFRATVNAYAQRLWAMVEATAQEPWFMGERFSALDLYVAVMSRWRPGRAWFSEHRPRLATIAAAADALPQLRGVWRRNWPDG